MAIVNIIIPARNEEEVIIKTLEDLKKKIKVPYKIIVVNDHSTDKTKEVVEKYIKKNKQSLSLRDKKVILVNNKRGQKGFGSALKIGFKNVKEGVVVFVMADLCDDPKTINKMYQKIQNGADIVCGSRYMKGGKKIDNDNWFQGLMSTTVNYSLHYLFQIPTTDMSNAFKMYRKEVLDKVKFNSESGVEASMEILGQCYFNGAKIIEIPTVWTGRKFGNSKFKILKRTPKYWRIYKWIIINKINKVFGNNLEEFYV